MGLDPAAGAKLGVPKSVKDGVGNLRYLAKTRNILKSASLPDANLDFYGSEQPEVHGLFAAALQDLTPESFTAFATARQQYIFKTVRSFLGFPGPLAEVM